ncbi:hypothetical protein SAMN06295998_11714 [Primorskyibacter flagellatus]|uniref:Uncharacterized protein n=1 Tax=Primorskyibacter flagellatus TaxID=1387277 RepID=A0A1W2DR70_9RHOB|nr:hypothetical protein SAMN06295998_11714 [Primorskyibacter flagellatus]
MFLAQRQAKSAPSYGQSGLLIYYYVNNSMAATEPCKHGVARAMSPFGQNGQGQDAPGLGVAMNRKHEHVFSIFFLHAGQQCSAV